MLVIKRFHLSFETTLLCCALRCSGWESATTFLLCQPVPGLFPVSLYQYRVIKENCGREKGLAPSIFFWSCQHHPRTVLHLGSSNGFQFVVFPTLPDPSSPARAFLLGYLVPSSTGPFSELVSFKNSNLSPLFPSQGETDVSCRYFLPLFNLSFFQYLVWN